MDWLTDFLRNLSIINFLIIILASVLIAIIIGSYLGFREAFFNQENNTENQSNKRYRKYKWRYYINDIYNLIQNFSWIKQITFYLQKTSNKSNKRPCQSILHFISEKRNKKIPNTVHPPKSTIGKNGKSTIRESNRENA